MSPHYDPVLTAMTAILNASINDQLLAIFSSLESFNNLTSSMDLMVQYSIGRLLKQYGASHEPVFKSNIRYQIAESNILDDSIIKIQTTLNESLASLHQFRENLNFLFNVTDTLVMLVT